eukprot:TRINITY_DN1596_c0_g1_i4.p2 TRINITY_DN1596_c0_g1~~TRINITY_DN1596_c0_g1_i4.p2  ORF type:complete len:118 (-),score=3.49 TRINITY_DN1596_c0_g1_i4:136-489(-)
MYVCMQDLSNHSILQTQVRQLALAATMSVSAAKMTAPSSATTPWRCQQNVHRTICKFQHNANAHPGGLHVRPPVAKEATGDLGRSAGFARAACNDDPQQFSLDLLLRRWVMCILFLV